MLGAVLIFFSCFLFGLLSAETLSLRVRKLVACRDYIRRIGEEMRHSHTELPLILDKIKSDVYLKDGIWQHTNGLKAEDLSVLLSYASALGTTDTHGQMNNTAEHIKRLDTLIEDAKEKNKSCSRLYLSLGALCGAFFAILVV